MKRHAFVLAICLVVTSGVAKAQESQTEIADKVIRALQLLTAEVGDQKQRLQSLEARFQATPSPTSYFGNGWAAYPSPVYSSYPPYGPYYGTGAYHAYRPYPVYPVYIPAYYFPRGYCYCD
jgi:hypothetical protein